MNALAKLLTHQLAFSFILFGVCLINEAFAAPPLRLSYSNKSISLKETFSISVHLSGFTSNRPPKFPDIEGFDKGEVTIKQPVTAAGEQVFTQYYIPLRRGVFQLKLFRIRVGMYQVSSKKSQLITVEDAIPNLVPRKNTLPASASEKTKIPYFDDSQGGALVLQTNRDEVFLSEELEATLYFYIKSPSTVPLDFPENIYSQINDLAEELHPVSCWEDRFGIERPVRELVTVRGQRYERFRLYRVLLYPFSEQDIVLPSVQLEMLKGSLSGRYSQSRLSPREPETFRSRAVRIAVKPLPDHPFKGEVAVGVFRVSEGISKFYVETGEQLGYSFGVEGYGNLRAAKLPEFVNKGAFEIYPPKIENLARQRPEGMLRSRVSRYSIIPKMPGTYEMADLFSWIYFNTDKAAYDTLQSSLRFFVDGDTVLTDVSVEQPQIDNTSWRGSSNKLRGKSGDSNWLINGVLIFVMLSLGTLILIKLIRK